MSANSTNEQNNKTPNVWTIREILTWTTNRFKQADIDTPLLDAQLLLCQVLNMAKINLYMEMDKPLSFAERSLLRELVKRRLSGEPVAYILKEKYWGNLKLVVDARVLIPRPETECLLDFVVETIKYYNKTPKIIVDFCTGSGCLAIALAKFYPESTVIGIDISVDALNVAQENAQLNKVTNVQWLNLDLTKAENYSFLKDKYGSAEIIVANPPYVSEEEWKKLDISVKNYEPKIALTADDNGLFIGKEIIKNLEQFSFLCSEFSLFGMEMAEGHPQKLIQTSSIKNYLFNSSVQEKCMNSWFGLCDLDSKSRFLCRLNNTN